MKLKAAFRLFNKWICRGVRLSGAMARHRGRFEQLNLWEYDEKERLRWVRHSNRLFVLKAHWFGED